MYTGFKPKSISQSINQINKQFLGGLSSRTTARSTGDSQMSSKWQQVDRKRLPEQMCLEEATKCGRWFCWCHVTSSGRSFHVYGGDCRKARLPTVDSLLVGTIRRYWWHTRTTELASLPVTNVQYCIGALSHRQQIRSISTDDNYLKPATSLSAWTTFRIHLLASPDTMYVNWDSRLQKEVK